MSSPATHYQFAVAQHGPVTVVTFQAPRLVKEGTVEAIGEHLFAMVEEHGCRQLVLDFSHVERIYSVMLGKVAGLHRKMQSVGGRLALCRMRAEVYDVFETLNLHQVLHIFTTTDDAVRSFADIDDTPRP
jgi:anti-anti-sigma factor